MHPPRSQALPSAPLPLAGGLVHYSERSCRATGRNSHVNRPLSLHRRERAGERDGQGGGGRKMNCISITLHNVQAEGVSSAQRDKCERVSKNTLCRRIHGEGEQRDTKLSVSLTPGERVVGGGEGARREDIYSLQCLNSCYSMGCQECFRKRTPCWCALCKIKKLSRYRPK